MASDWEIFLWLLKKAPGAVRDQFQDLGGWIKENKLTCSLIVAGIGFLIVPGIVGFGALGPVAGSIAAGWQSAIGNVAAGSLFAILQSMSMTGVFASIGGWTIVGGILRFLSTFKWPAIAAGLGERYIENNSSRLRNARSVLNRTNRVLWKIDRLTRSRATTDEDDDLKRILERISGIQRVIGRLFNIKRIHDLIQRLDAESAGDMTAAEIEEILTQLRDAMERFSQEDSAAGSLLKAWTICLDLACEGCKVLGEALDDAVECGAYGEENEAKVQGLLRDLKDVEQKLALILLEDKDS